MAAPTPNEYIVQRAHRWWKTKKDLTGAAPAEKPAKQSAHRQSEKKLGEAVDLAARKNVPVVEG